MCRGAQQVNAQVCAVFAAACLQGEGMPDTRGDGNGLILRKWGLRVMANLQCHRRRPTGDHAVVHFVAERVTAELMRSPPEYE